ncbi:mitochondrial import inner membrane translocase subunit Tim29 [Ochotona curzoniae]|uniref:mitochondrial import inner membrane translocase subunit Tim29 n=1 Tax=Ochotona curzoniae TaxID=130825 RepID=UPI001B353A23|nr:mitochondrial import inner membrane translocase subunit Tim29 [Ochotona curzoniae]
MAASARGSEAAGKPGLAARLGAWARVLLRDYGEACRDAAAAARARPGRAAMGAGLLGGLALSAALAPGEAALDEALLDASGRLLLLAPATRRPDAEAFVQRLLWLRGRGRLRLARLGVCSLAYEAPVDAEVSLYQARCPHLQPRWSELAGRVLDVGALGRWWVLGSRMRDCDVNDREFLHLPPHLRVLRPGQLRSENNERLFQEKYLPVVLTDDQVDQALWEEQVLQQRRKEQLALREAGAA